MKPLFMILLSAVVLSSCHHKCGREETVHQFVEKVDEGTATSRFRHVGKQENKVDMARLSKLSYLKHAEDINVLYAEDGKVIYDGGPATLHELVWLNSAAGPIQVPTVLEPRGTYVAFTPEVVYSVDFDSGLRHAVPRDASVAAAVGKTRPAFEAEDVDAWLAEPSGEAEPVKQEPEAGEP